MCPRFVKHRAAPGCIFMFRWEQNIVTISRRCLRGSLVGIVHKQIPDYTSLERNGRQPAVGKMYIDFLQNRPGATIAGPYSLRPKVGATVSMPLHWDEVKPGLTLLKDFTIFNSIARLRSKGDLFRVGFG